MKQKEIDFLMHCLMGEWTYAYRKDKYALHILNYMFPGQHRVSEVKSSRYKGLLNKSLVSELLAQSGDGLVNFNPEHAFDPNDKYFRISLGTWGEVQRWKKGNYHQVTRPELNLTLLVNFDKDHDLIFFQGMGKENVDMFGMAFHPNSPKHNTLGWARLDISLETNEVLIEEVQNDWLRDVKYYQRQLKLADKQDQKYWLHDYEAWWSKYTEFVWVYMKMWDELILSATLWFIRDELGIENVWYHSFDSSNYYKQVSRYSQPPRSVYTALPRKFGFEETLEVPRMIRECRSIRKLVRRGQGKKFYKMELTN